MYTIPTTALRSFSFHKLSFSCPPRDKRFLRSLSCFLGELHRSRFLALPRRVRRLRCSTAAVIAESLLQDRCGAFPPLRPLSLPVFMRHRRCCCHRCPFRRHIVVRVVSPGGWFCPPSPLGGGVGDPRRVDRCLVNGRGRGVLETIEICLEIGGVAFEGGNLGTEGQDELVCIDRCLYAILDGCGRVGIATTISRRGRYLFWAKGAWQVTCLFGRGATTTRMTATPGEFFFFESCRVSVSAKLSSGGVSTFLRLA